MRYLSILAALTLALASIPASAITIQDVTTPGGLHAWLVEDHKTQVISLDFAIACGAACDPVDKTGLSVYATALLDEGAGPYDSGNYQGKLANLSASVDFDAEDDFLTGRLTTLSPSREEVFDLMRLAVTDPHFDPPAVARIHAEIDQLIDSQEQDPGSVATHRFLATEFPDHPYGRWVSGTKESISRITSEDLHHFAKTRLGRDTLMIAVVGDITPAELARLLDKTFGALPAKTEISAVPQKFVPAAAAQVLIDHLANPQSVATFGQPGLAIRDKDFFVSMVVNRVLGGAGFSSRLEQEIREKRGLAYGVTTNLENREYADFIIGNVGTQNAKMNETIDIIRQQWTKMRDTGPSESEVADAKRYLNGSYTIGLGSSSAIAQRLIGLQENHLGRDYFERRPKAINAVTLTDAKRVASSLLDPSKLLFAVAGNPTIAQK